MNWGDGKEKSDLFLSSCMIGRAVYLSDSKSWRKRSREKKENQGLRFGHTNLDMLAHQSSK